MSMPIRRTWSPCCARAVTGHAAALPNPVMKSRRRIGHASKPLCWQRIAVRVAWERVASRRGTNFLRPFCSALVRTWPKAEITAARRGGSFQG
jgi:hypothetical protein